MDAYYQNHLFADLSYEDYRHMLPCLNGYEKTFLPGETVCCFDGSFRRMGILSQGNASVVRYEVNGSRTILERLGPRDLFGETLAFGPASRGAISVVCDTRCQILFIDYARISAPCAKACPCHQQLIRNILGLICEKSLDLSQRVEVLSQRTIRDKLMCCFLQLAGRERTRQFTLPFTMVDLADYLSVDRSAMTRELRHMREAGLISLDKRQVTLLPPDV